MFRNVFSIVISTEIKDIPQKPAKLTFGLIQKWIEDNHGMKVSKSSITHWRNENTAEDVVFMEKVLNAILHYIEQEVVLADAEAYNSKHLKSTK